MSIEINDLQLNMTNAIDLFVKMTSFLMTTQMGTQISYFLKSSRKYKFKFQKKKSVGFNFFV